MARRRGRGRWVSWGAALVGAAAIWTGGSPAAVGAAGEPVGTEPLRLATASAGGTYEQLGRRIAERARERLGRPIQVLNTAGSYDNAERLANGEADLAILQSDVAYLEYFQKGRFLAVAPLSTEPIQIVARRELGLSRLSELLLRDEPAVWKVAIGAPGSGSAAHARQVLHRLGIEAKRLRILEISLADALDGIRVRAVDVAFVTATVPHPLIREAAARQMVSVLGIDDDILAALKKSNPSFTLTEVPFDAYSGMQSNVRTLGTEALLVARTDLDGAVVRSLLEVVATVAEHEGLGLPPPDSAQLVTAVEEVPIPLHRSASRYYDEELNLVAIGVREVSRLGIPIVLVALLSILLLRLPAVAYFLRQFVLLRLVAALTVIWLLGSGAMYLFEAEKNSNFRSFGQSSVAILHYLFSGLEAKYPVTPPGIVLSIIILTLGAAILTIFTATLVRILVEKALSVRRLRTKPVSFAKLRDHLIVAGWSRRAERIVRQLRSDDVPRQIPVAVIAPQVEDTRLEKSTKLQDVWVIEGDLTDPATLRRADVDRAHAALVLHDPSAGRLADVRSVAAALAIERINPGVHTVVEVLDAAGIEHLDCAGVDEPLDASGLAGRLLSQTLITPGIVAIYEELLSFGRGSQELHFVPVPGSLEGATFRQAARRLANKEAIPIGWHDGSTTVLNPPRSADRERPLTGDDCLILVADDSRVLRAYDRWRLRRRRRTSSEGILVEEGAVTPDQMERDQLRERRVGLCGWSPQVPRILTELRSGVISPHHRFEVTWVVEDEPENLSEELGGASDVRVVHGDPTRRSVLEAAGIQRLDSLAILASADGAEGGDSADHRSLMIALAARNLCPDLHLVTEVRDAVHRHHFEQVGGVEIVGVQRLSELLLAQAVVHPGITDVYQRLLTAEGDSNEIYMLPVPAGWVGRTFQETYLELLQSSREVILLGYEVQPERNERVAILNPAQRRHERSGVEDFRGHRFQSGERVVLLAYEEPSAALLVRPSSRAEAAATEQAA